ncbi:MAG: glycosyltransferase [Candidatus Sumerlaeia bacterium]|nr:glycosyltransferase [Candidatus Sumerlaeia bacterium]
MTSPPKNHDVSPPTNTDWTRSLRIALVHDWLNGMRGGEKVLEQFCTLFPGADLHTLIYEPERVSPLIRSMNVIESPFARLPGARTNYRSLLPIMPAFVSKLPTPDYDLVLSTSHCVAKGARRPRRGKHLSYVFSPMRYVWDHFPDYLGSGFVKDAGLRVVRPWMQKWDRRSCTRVDSFAADSRHIARKMAKFWNRRARVIHPPVDLETFKPDFSQPDEYFVVVSALVPYKMIGRAIEAARIARVPLKVIGDGPERSRLEQLADKRFIEFLGWVPDDELAHHYRRARALLFPGVEDFGITSLEAQASGRPVLALRNGGVMETVVEGSTGAFFDHPTAKSLARLIRHHNDSTYESSTIRNHAESFSPTNFRENVLRWIEGKVGGGS